MARHHRDPDGEGPALEDLKWIDTAHGRISVAISHEGDLRRWRIRPEPEEGWRADQLQLVTERGDGDRQAFTFAQRAGYLESLEAVPEPHHFLARLRLAHGGHGHAYAEADRPREHTHDYTLPFVPARGDPQDEAAAHAAEHGLDIGREDYEDAHARAHAEQVRSRLRPGQKVTKWQIILFGLAGGLIPCPAAVTVLVLALTSDQIAYAIISVFAFSIGLAATLVAVGMIAAVGARKIGERWQGFSRLAQRAPYVSGVVIILVGIYVTYHGVSGLAAAS